MDWISFFFEEFTTWSFFLKITAYKYTYIYTDTMTNLLTPAAHAHAG